jgi:hypothetical protein
MKVFICWAGPLSKEMALILRQYLPNMIQRLDIFMSQHDIESGARWNAQLIQELSSSNFGILCLTPESITSEWLLYEAGALTKHIEGEACGLLLGGLSSADIKGPLAQFQHRYFSKSDFFALLCDLNRKTLPPLNDTQLDIVFEKWWEDINTSYQKALLQTKGNIGPFPHRDMNEILEEILDSVRGFERQLANQALTLGMSSPVQITSPTSDEEIVTQLIKKIDSSKKEICIAIGEAGMMKRYPQLIDSIIRARARSVPVNIYYQNLPAELLNALNNNGCNMIRGTEYPRKHFFVIDGFAYYHLHPRRQDVFAENDALADRLISEFKNLTCSQNTEG